MQFLSEFLLFCSFFLLQASTGPAATTPGTSGIKMTRHSGSGETTNDETTFIQSDRSRMEYRGGLNAVHGNGTLDTRPGPRLAGITRCDLGQVFELNLEDREYVADTFPRFKLTKEQMEARMKETRTKARMGIAFYKVAPWAPTVRQERTTVDTGDRRNFFGHQARHMISRRKTIPLAGSHLEPQDNVTEGWYIDLDTGTSCEFRWPLRNEEPRHEYYAIGGERYEIIDDGIRVMGFATESKETWRLTVTQRDGTKRETGGMWAGKVTEFYEGPLDPALFEVPGDFRKVSELRREPPLTLADRWYLTSGWVKGLARDFFK